MPYPERQQWMDEQLKQIIDRKVAPKDAIVILVFLVFDLTERVKRLEKLVYGAVAMILITFFAALIGLVIKQ